MIDKTNIRDSIADLYDDALNHSAIKPIDRQFVLKRVDKLRQFDAVELIVQVSTHFDRRDNISLLLCAPELWAHLRAADWLHIINNVSERPSLAFGESFGEYTDVEFLTCYLKVDAIALVTGSESSVSAISRKRICEFCISQADNLFLNDEDLSSFDGKNRCSLSELEKSHDHLVQEHSALSPTYSDPQSLRLHAEHVLQKLIN